MGPLCPRKVFLAFPERIPLLTGLSQLTDRVGWQLRKAKQLNLSESPLLKSCKEKERNIRLKLILRAFQRADQQPPRQAGHKIFLRTPSSQGRETCMHPRCAPMSMQRFCRKGLFTRTLEFDTRFDREENIRLKPSF